MNMVDARGHACPEPVMMTREALHEDAAGVEVLVDSACAAENITRFAGNFGYAVAAVQNGDETKLTLTKS